jgi:hypothetical protein
MFIRHSRNAQMSQTAVRQFRLFSACCYFPLLHGGTGERGSAACTPPRSLFISFFRKTHGIADSYFPSTYYLLKQWDIRAITFIFPQKASI